MSAILVALLVLGLVVGFTVIGNEAQVKQRPMARQHRRDQLDMTDEMVLHGEVTGDPFYDIM